MQDVLNYHIIIYNVIKTLKMFPKENTEKNDEYVNIYYNKNTECSEIK